MAKATIEERRLKFLAELKKLDQEEKVERTDRHIKLGVLSEKYLKGEVDIHNFIDAAETVTGWKFAGARPGKRIAATQSSAEISE